MTAFDAVKCVKMKRISDDQLDLIFHAISDRTRRSLLERLIQGPAMITELAKPFEMSLPAVSKHLRVLESAGLIVRQVDGRIHCCSLAPSPLQAAEHWFKTYRIFWIDTLEGLSRYAKDAKPKRVKKDKA